MIVMIYMPLFIDIVLTVKLLLMVISGESLSKSHTVCELKSMNVELAKLCWEGWIIGTNTKVGLQAFVHI